MCFLLLCRLISDTETRIRADYEWYKSRIHCRPRRYEFINFLNRIFYVIHLNLNRANGFGNGNSQSRINTSRASWDTAVLYQNCKPFSKYLNYWIVNNNSFITTGAGQHSDSLKPIYKKLCREACLEVRPIEDTMEK